METPKLHEMAEPVREIGNIVVDWIAKIIFPEGTFDGIAQESAQRTVEMFTQDRLFEE